jgi:hypothetical protein
LRWVRTVFKIVHRRATDCAQNFLVLIEHREFNDHPIEVVILDLTSLPMQHMLANGWLLSRPQMLATLAP